MKTETRSSNKVKGRSTGHRSPVEVRHGCAVIHILQFAPFYSGRDACSFQRPSCL